MTQSQKLGKSSVDVVRSLGITIRAAYKLAPATVVLGAVIASVVILVSLLSSALMVGLVLCIVWLVSVLIYVRTTNFGEAALSLVAGLLTAFGVEWTPWRFLAFSVIWVGFAFSALLIASFRMYMRVERIYKQAAVALAKDAGEIGSLERELLEIGERTSNDPVDPVERAEAIRLLAYRKIPIRLMRPILQAAETIATASYLTAIRVVALLADFYRAQEENASSFGSVIEAIDLMMRRSAVSPEAFLTGFEKEV